MSKPWKYFTEEARTPKQNTPDQAEIDKLIVDAINKCHEIWKKRGWVK